MICKFGSLKPVDEFVLVGNSNAWGIYQVSKNCYYTNLLHGGADGSTYLQETDGSTTPISIQEFRAWVELEYGLLPEDILIVSSCYPKEMIKKSEYTLKSRNMIVLFPGSEEITYFVYFEGKIFVAPDSEFSRAENEHHKYYVEDLEKQSCSVRVDTHSKRVWATKPYDKYFRRVA